MCIARRQPRKAMNALQANDKPRDKDARISFCAHEEAKKSFLSGILASASPNHPSAKVFARFFSKSATDLILSTPL
jgi:hypothetical protein